MSFCIYGFGSTGKSAAKYLKNKNFHNVKIWDDTKKTKTEQKLSELTGKLKPKTSN